MLHSPHTAVTSPSFGSPTATRSSVSTAADASLVEAVRNARLTRIYQVFQKILLDSIQIDGLSQESNDSSSASSSGSNAIELTGSIQGLSNGLLLESLLADQAFLDIWSDVFPLFAADTKKLFANHSVSMAAYRRHIARNAGAEQVIPDNPVYFAERQKYLAELERQEL